MHGQQNIKKDHTGMHGQQNIKKIHSYLFPPTMDPAP